MARQTTIQDLREDRDRNWGFVYDKLTGKRITIQWDLNKEAKENRVFKIVVDGKDVYLNVDEVQKLLRWV